MNSIPGTTSLKLILAFVAVSAIACDTSMDQSARDGTDGLSATGTAGTDLGETASAELRDLRANAIGRATFRQTPNGVLVSLNLHNAPAGTHAVHIHESGRCEAPSFESAGAHFAPSARQHGFLHQDGPHAGDLPNVHVPDSKRLSVEFVVAGIALGSGDRAILDADGSAIVVHADADDYRTNPAGASGDRVACGVIAQ